MITNRMTKQMIDLQKSTLDMMLNTMSDIQEQSGRATQAWFEQMAGLPREGVEAMNNWMNSMRESRNQFNSAVQEGFENWGNVAGRTMRQTEAAARKYQRPAQQQSADQRTETGKSQPPSEDDLQKLKEQLEEGNP